MLISRKRGKDCTGAASPSGGVACPVPAHPEDVGAMDASPQQRAAGRERMPLEAAESDARPVCAAVTKLEFPISRIDPKMRAA
jgi:hypothetical protein